MNTAIDRDVGDLFAALQPHIVERAAIEARLASLGGGLEARHPAGDRHHVLRARAPGDDRRQIGGVEPDLLVEMRAFVGLERLPMAHAPHPRRRPWAPSAGP